MYAVALKRRTPLSASALNRSRIGRTTLQNVVCSRSESTSSTFADPYSLLTPEMTFMRQDTLKLLGSSVPSLDEVAKSYFLRPSKHLRPRLVLLFSQATNGLGTEWAAKRWHAEQKGAGGRMEGLNQPMTRPDVLNDYNPSQPQNTVPFGSLFSLQPPTRSTRPSPPPQHTSVSSLVSPPVLLPTQIRLAQIVEMIHVASLLHDDVIDRSSLRRGESSAPAAYGERLTILGGNFILGRASVALSRLGDAEVVELFADIVPNLVEGEILQLKDTYREPSESGVNKPMGLDERWNYYLQRTYLKTASLIANGLRAAVALGGCGQEDIWRDMAYTYGRNLGLAFQLIDDVLDYEAGEKALGKPSAADLSLGLATGPALYAWEEYPEMGPLIERNFTQEGDVELATDYVRRSSGIVRTQNLAKEYASKAKDTIQGLPESEAKIALEVMTDLVTQRKH